MRYFLAIPLPEEIKKELHAINAFLSKFKDLRLVSPDNMHLTLLFLGENGDLKKIDKLKKINFDSFNLKTKKVSVFPSDGKIKLVWIELEESKKLLRLQQKISELFNITANYKPHITLARIKKIDKVDLNKYEKEVDYKNKEIENKEEKSIEITREDIKDFTKTIIDDLKKTYNPKEDLDIKELTKEAIKKEFGKI